MSSSFWLDIQRSGTWKQPVMSLNSDPVMHIDEHTVTFPPTHTYSMFELFHPSAFTPHRNFTYSLTSVVCLKCVLADNQPRPAQRAFPAILLGINCSKAKFLMTVWWSTDTHWHWKQSGVFTLWTLHFISHLCGVLPNYIFIMWGVGVYECVVLKQQILSQSILSVACAAITRMISMVYSFTPWDVWIYTPSLDTQWLFCVSLETV